MDLAFTPAEEAFRTEVRNFLDKELPQDLADKVGKGDRLAKSDTERWQAILSRKGWLAPHWPKEYGGADWSPRSSAENLARCSISPLEVATLPSLSRENSRRTPRFWGWIFASPCWIRRC